MTQTDVYSDEVPLNSTDSPVVVIAMPTYNHVSFVADAIDSVLAQTYTRWALIIINDGSTDGTRDVIHRYDDPRILIVDQNHVGLSGLGRAYTNVLSESQAPLVAILEGDDRWPRDKLQRQVPDFDDPQVVLSYGAGFLIDRCGCEYGRVTPFAPAVRLNRPVGSIVPSMLSVNPILSPTVVVRRAALDSVGGFWQPDGVPYVDHPTWLLLASKGHFAYHDKPVGSWRRHPAQWTTQVVATSGRSPEAAYLEQVANRYGEALGRLLPTVVSDVEPLLRPHVERATSNRWRLAILAASPLDVVRMATGLIRSGNSRSIGIALLGLVFWLAGSDLEWIQVRRNRVAWPSRRHKHFSPCNDLLPPPVSQ